MSWPPPGFRQSRFYESFFDPQENAMWLRWDGPPILSTEVNNRVLIRSQMPSLSPDRRGSRGFLDPQEGAVRLSFHETESEDQQSQDGQEGHRASGEAERERKTDRADEYEDCEDRDWPVEGESTEPSASPVPISAPADRSRQPQSPLGQEDGRDVGDEQEEAGLHGRSAVHGHPTHTATLSSSTIGRDWPKPQRTSARPAFDMFAALDDFNARTA